jgi:hypothetical protein
MRATHLAPLLAALLALSAAPGTRVNAQSDMTELNLAGVSAAEETAAITVVNAEAGPSGQSAPKNLRRGGPGSRHDKRADLLFRWYIVGPLAYCWTWVEAAICSCNVGLPGLPGSRMGTQALCFRLCLRSAAPML